MLNNSIQNRYNFMMLFDVKNGNPNGDPDADNMPRIDPETNMGLVTDLCLKRKIRNWIQMNKDPEKGYDIYINDQGTLNSKDESALVAKNEAKPAKKDEEQFVIDFMTRRYFDVRTFGAVMTGFKKKEAKLSGKAGQITGPVQLVLAQSVDPIYPQNLTITRCAITTEKDAEEKDNEMGNKWIVPYGLYCCKGYVSANLAKRTGFSEEDLETLWSAIVNMFEDDRSAARGEMVMRKLIIFKHEGKEGTAQAHKLFGLVKVAKKENVDTPRNYSDYDVYVPSQDELPEGVTIDVRD